MRAQLLAAALVLTACDPLARRDDSAGLAGAAPAESRLGHAEETCGRVADCAEPLRCVDAVCVPAESSTLAEYYWAAASVSDVTGGSPAELYQKAAAQFETDKVPAPAAFLCDHGRYLLSQPGAQSGEQAARLLHRCLLGSPPGSHMRREALRGLAVLGARGLEPTLVARKSPVDTYLVHPVTPPAADRLAVEVSRATPAGDKGYSAFVAMLESDRATPALARCFAEEWQRTHSARMVVTLPLRLRARLDGNDEYAGGTLDIGGEGEAAQCLRAALAPLAAEIAKSGSSGSWQGSVTVTVHTR